VRARFKSSGALDCAISPIYFFSRITLGYLAIPKREFWRGRVRPLTGSLVRGSQRGSVFGDTDKSL
jgi:hypothetical protein